MKIQTINKIEEVAIKGICAVKVLNYSSLSVGIAVAGIIL